MATQAQIDANRLNAQKSTGPRTPDGKAAIRQNAFRHGFTSSIPVTQRETFEKVEVQPLLAAFVEENQPVGINEEVLVYQMAEHFLFQRRASALLTSEIIDADYAEKNTPEIALVLRYHTTAVRGFSKTLNDLRKLQKERKLQEIGFVSQEVEEIPVETPAEPQTPPAAPPELAPEAATQPIPAPSPAEPTSTRPSQPRESTEKELANPPDTPPQAAHLNTDEGKWKPGDIPRFEPRSLADSLHDFCNPGVNPAKRS